jgi:hypothetical protein
MKDSQGLEQFFRLSSRRTAGFHRPNRFRRRINADISDTFLFPELATLFSEHTRDTLNSAWIDEEQTIKRLEPLNHRSNSPRFLWIDLHEIQHSVFASTENLISLLQARNRLNRFRFIKGNMWGSRQHPPREKLVTTPNCEKISVCEKYRGSEISDRYK